MERIQSLDAAGLWHRAARRWLTLLDEELDGNGRCLCVGGPANRKRRRFGIYLAVGRIEFGVREGKCIRMMTHSYLPLFLIFHHEINL